MIMNDMLRTLWLSEEVLKDLDRTPICVGSLLSELYYRPDSLNDLQEDWEYIARENDVELDDILFLTYTVM